MELFVLYKKLHNSTPKIKILFLFLYFLQIAL